jgi:meckelin
VKTDSIIAGKQYYGTLYKCQLCPDPYMVMGAGNVCTCIAGYTITGVVSVGAQSCVLISQATNFIKLEGAAQNVRYSDVGTTVLSATMLHYYTKAASRCSFFGSADDLQYCNQLANLCALQLFNDQTSACSSYLSITGGRGNQYISDVTNWVTGMPWLYFSGGSAACFATIDTESVSLRNYQLQYIVGTFTMNGTFLGYQPMNTLLSYCGISAPNSDSGGGTSSNSKYQNYADVTSDTYSCDLSTLYGTQQLFYELYLSGSTFIPIPVRIVNLATGTSATQPNKLRPLNSLCDSGDVLVRRFFLVDLISGLTSGSTGLPVVMRYASQISLEVSQTTGNVRNIYPPVLTIQYTEVSPPAPGTKGAVVSYRVQGRFTSNLKTFFQTLFGFFIAGVVVTGLLFVLTYMNWNIRNSRSLALTVSSTSIGGINGRVLIEMSIMLLHCWVLVFFPFTVLVTWYGFVFFKLQSFPAVLLPAMDAVYSVTSPYYSFTVMLHVLTFFQLAYVCMLVHRQSNADIFFLDWEPSKTRNGEKKGNVSVWRTILVANEYSEMQTKRKTDIKFTLFFIVLVLIGQDLQYNATQQPSVADISQGKQNVVLRFAQTTFWWFIFSAGQYLWKFLIYEVYIAFLALY